MSCQEKKIKSPWGSFALPLGPLPLEGFMLLHPGRAEYSERGWVGRDEGGLLKQRGLGCNKRYAS